MGGGDLNLKKSWHPNTFKNQERVWKREQQVAEEQRKSEQLRKEIQEERDREELQGLYEKAGKRYIIGLVNGRKKNLRLEWMYAAGPTQTHESINQEKEDFLLGKKRIDKVDHGIPEEQTPIQNAASLNSMYGMHANSTRDFQNKVREDPLLVFRKQEQASLEAMLNNPERLKQLQKMKDEKKKKKKSKKSHRSRSRSISRSPERPKSQNDENKLERPRDRDRSPKKVRAYEKHDREEKRYDRYEREEKRYDRYEREDRYRRNDDRKYRTEERYRGNDSYSKRTPSDQERRFTENGSAKRDEKRQAEKEEIEREKEDKQKEMKRKLEAMKKNATTWKKEVEDYVHNEKEKEQRELDEDERLRSSRNDENSFSIDIHKKSFENIDTSDMIRRNKNFSQRHGGMMDR
ncbi:Pre-mRNA splicing factor-domain-containing protein [Globomyces pollinis-pini]|nr:Pre-mRNA splicing factor-domain-containing protein [Globomyces pollinis-pini]